MKGATPAIAALQNVSRALSKTDALGNLSTDIATGQPPKWLETLRPMLAQFTDAGHAVDEHWAIGGPAIRFTRGGHYHFVLEITSMCVSVNDVLHVAALVRKLFGICSLRIHEAPSADEFTIFWKHSSAPKPQHYQKEEKPLFGSGARP